MTIAYDVIDPLKCKNPNQYRPRGTTPIYSIVVHTDEYPMHRPLSQLTDLIVNRSDYGSYHGVANVTPNPDGPTGLVYTNPLRWKASHVRDDNDVTIGIALHCTTDELREMRVPERRLAMVRLAELDVAMRNRYGYDVPTTKRDGKRTTTMPGYYTHQQLDPERRVDPGPAFDWHFYLDEVRRQLKGVEPVPEPRLRRPERDWTLGEINNEIVALYQSFGRGFDLDGQKYWVGQCTHALYHDGPPTVSAILTTLFSQLAGKGGVASARVSDENR